MNIFILDENPKLCAQYHCDKHVVKMILEHVQMLSTVSGHGYKPTHKNHPCTKWVAESLDNYFWLVELTTELNNEWQYRYGHTKNHKSYDMMLTLPVPNLPQIGLTPFAQAMPTYCRDIDAVTAYRTYYRLEKQSILKYTKRDLPNFIH
jgi:hypothetical protein